MLLVVLSISLVGVFTLCFTHCCHHMDHSTHHHCVVDSDECQGHDLALHHCCVIDHISDLRYEANSCGVDRIRLSSRLLFLVAIVLDIEENDVCCDSYEYNRRRSCYLYNKYIPTLGLLRAPPVLV